MPALDEVRRGVTDESQRLREESDAEISRVGWSAWAAQVRAQRKPSPVRAGRIPLWLGKLLTVAKNAGRLGPGVHPMPRCTYLDAADRQSGRGNYYNLLDHWGTTVLPDGREAFVSEPYGYHREHAMAFAELLGLTWEASCNSWHFPGRTTRLTFLPLDGSTLPVRRARALGVALGPTWPRGSEGFIKAILGESNDVTHRLIFADWLEDRGDPRAKFLRWPLPPSGSNTWRLVKPYLRGLLGGLVPKSRRAIVLHDDQLLDKGLTARWLDSSLGMCSGEVWAVLRHGFISELACTEKSWFKRLHELLATQPLVEVRLNHAIPEAFDERGLLGPTTWGWFREPLLKGKAVPFRPLCSLSPEFFDLLEGGELVGEPGGRGRRREVVTREYQTKIKAALALSDALIAWGRVKLCMSPADHAGGFHAGHP